MSRVREKKKGCCPETELRGRNPEAELRGCRLPIGLRVFKQKRKKNNLIMAAQGAGRRRFRGKAARWDFSETSPLHS